LGRIEINELLKGCFYSTYYLPRCTCHVNHKVSTVR